MQAYKFLRPHAVGPFSGFRWPLPTGGAPGRWVTAPGRLQPCLNGVHACRISDLPFWLTEELWRIELEGAVVEEETVVIAERGRLVSRVDEWTGETALEYADACAARARGHAAAAPDVAGYAHDAEGFAAAAREDRFDLVAVAAFAAAHTSDYADERRWQAAWLGQRLAL
jgi:hypothetical protein